VAAALSMATHYFATLAIVPQAVLLLLAHPRRRTVRLGVGVAALCGLGLIPLAISQNGAGNDSWIATEPLRLRLAQIIPQFLIGTDAPAREAFKYVAFALVLAAFVLLAVRFRRLPAPQRTGVVVAMVLAVGGFALGLVLILAGFDVLITRNLIELWLPAAIVVAAGCAAASGVRARIGLATAGALCAIGLAAAIAVGVSPSMQRPDWPGVARILGSEPAPGQSRVILIQRFQTLLPLKLYLPGLARLRSATAATELDVISMRSPQPAALLVGRRVQPDRLADAVPLRDPGNANGLDPPRRTVHDPAAGRDAAGDDHRCGRGARPDRDVAGRGRADGPAAARLSSVISAALRRRTRPDARSPRVSGPNAIRSRRATRCPIASDMRLTWRLRPSRIVSSNVSCPTRRASAGAVRPSSSSTPSRSLAICMPVTGPRRTTTR
jgi:hypothetical protein